MARNWMVGVDIGGTFTDVVALHVGDAVLRTAKVPSRPDDPVGALLAALEAVGIGHAAVENLVHGTTRITNAIVEGKLPPVALITTEGFEDVLAIGRLRRRDLYRLDRLARSRSSVSVGSVSSYDRTGGNDDGFSGKHSFIREEDDGLVTETELREGVEEAGDHPVHVLHVGAEVVGLVGVVAGCRETAWDFLGPHHRHFESKRLHFSLCRQPYVFPARITGLPPCAGGSHCVLQ